MKMKKFLSVVLTIIMIFSAMPLAALELHLPAFGALFRSTKELAPTAHAADYLTSGYCGDTVNGDGTNIAWSIDADGVLTLTGSGVMGSTPNREDNRVTKLIVGEGITRLADYAFAYCQNLVEIVLPSTLETTGGYTFTNNPALTTIDFGGTTEIGSYAFSQCNGLIELILPESVKTVSDYAFYLCANLNSIKMRGAEVIGSYAFFKCSGLTEVVLSEHLETIGSYAFSGDKFMNVPVTPQITELTIPGSVRTIGSHAFENVLTLQTVSFSEGLLEIGASAFSCGTFANQIEAIEFPNSLQTIGDNAFKHNYRLKSVSFGNGLITIGNGAFTETGIEELNFPESINSIGTSAFEKCGGLAGDVRIPDSCSSVGSNAFSQTKVESFYIGAGLVCFGTSTSMSELKRIDVSENNITYASYDGVLYDKAFTQLIEVPVRQVLNLPKEFPLSGKNALPSWGFVESVNAHADSEVYSSYDGILYSKDGKKVLYCPVGRTNPIVVIQGQTETIADNAFSGCSKIESVTFADTVTSVGNRAFFKCSSLTEVILSEHLETIGSYAFSGDKFLNVPVTPQITELTIPGSVRTIGSHAFEYVYTLQTVTFSEGLLEIGAGAFSCGTIVNQIEAIEFPNSLQTIGDNAFKRNSRLKSVSFGNGLKTIGNGAFTETGIEELNLPESITSIGTSAFEKCSNLAGNVRIPDSCSSVGSNAFSQTKVESFYIGAGMMSFGTSTSMSELKRIDVSEDNINYASYDGVLYDKAFTQLIEVPVRQVLNLPKEFPLSGKNALPSWGFVESVNAHADSEVYSSYDGILYSKDGKKVLYCPVGRTNSVVVIQEQTETIADNAFSGCSKIESVTFADTVTSVGNRAFFKCSDLTEVVLSEHLETIGNYAFSGETLLSVPIAPKITELTIPGSVRTIGSHAFEYVYTLQTVTFSEGLLEIGASAFSCGTIVNQIEAIEFPNSLQTIGDNAFKRNSRLKSVSFGNGLKTIGNGAFTENGVEELNLPDSLERIGNKAFSKMSSLTKLVLGKGILYLSSDILEGSNNIKTIQLTENTQSWNFGQRSVSNLSTFIVPNPYTEIINYGKVTAPEDGVVQGYCGSPAHTFAVKRQYAFESIGHTFLDWYTVTPATFESEGIERRDCAGCDAYEERVIPKLEHQSFTATFVADGNIVAKIDFPKDATSLEEPAVPAKDRYTGRWEDYTLSNEDITINAVYTLITSGDVSEIETDSEAIHYIETDNVLFKMAAYSEAKTVKSVVSQSVPLDIVLVVDQSGSMEDPLGGSVRKVDALKSAAHEFIDAVTANAALTGADHRVSIVGFGLAGKYQGYQDNENTELLTSGRGIVPFADITPADYASSLISIENINALNEAIDGIEARGATAADLGLEMAKGVFANTDSTGRDRIVVFMTDGAPTYQSNFQTAVANSAIANAGFLKSTYGALVYSVGVFSAADAANGNINRFMQAVSSNYPNARSLTALGTAESNSFFTNVNHTDSLSGVFRTITTESLSHTATFDNVTLIKTLSKYVTLTAPQEQALRISAIRKYGISDDAITVTRNADGTTMIKLESLTPYEVERDGKVLYEVSLEFFASLNENAAAAGDYDVDDEDSGVMLGDAIGYEATFDTNSITLSEGKTRYLFTINGELYEIAEGSTVAEAVPETDFSAEWQFSGWDISDVPNTNGFVIDATLVKAPRTVVWHTADGDITQYYTEGQYLEPPVVPDRADGSKFLSWNRSLPTVMPDTDLEFTAVYGEHVHNYVSADEVPATCTADGVRRFTCICGDTYTETLPMLGHDFEAITPSTDQEASRCTFVCNNCGQRYEYALDYEIKVNTDYGRALTYEFQLTDDDLNIGFEPDGSIVIRIPLSEFQSGAWNVRVKRTVDGHIDLVPAEIKDGFLIIYADHFTPYEIEFIFECMESGEHDWDAGTLTKAATCSESGEITYTCSLCGMSKIEYTDLDPNNHADYGTKVINAVAATCVSDGYTGDTVCAGCEALFASGETISKDTIPHTWNSGSVTKVATCSEKGTILYTCTVQGCSATYEESIIFDFDNHADYGTEVINAVEATCYSDGYTGDTVCARCGAVFTPGETISKDTVPHTWNDGEVTMAATCSETGTMLYTCTVDECGATREEEIETDSDNHADYGTEIENEVAATCYSDGYTGNTVCARCRAILALGEIIPKETVSHTWNAGEISSPATCSETGTMLYTCTVEGCGATREEPIGLNAHNHADYGTEVINAVPVTCHSDGYTGDTICVRCRAVLTHGDTISKDTVEHTWDEGSVTLKPTCKATGTMLYRCTVKSCGATKEETIQINPNAHVYNVTVTEPTCTKGGYTTHTCTLCSYEFKDQQTAALGHTYGFRVTPATCTSEGYTTCKCTRCGDTYIKDRTPPVDHVDNNHDGYCDLGCGTTFTIPDPGEQQPQSNCACGKYHSGPMAGIIIFFHRIVYFFKNLFSR